MRNRFTLRRDGNRWLLLDERNDVAIIDLDETDLVSLWKLVDRALPSEDAEPNPGLF